MSYLRRAIDSQLDQLLPHISAIALEGPKAVGKTYTATNRADSILRLDAPSDQQILQADPQFASLPGRILIDEWQRLPESWDYVRRAVDAGAPKGRFLLTGSATPVSGTHIHSGAGRILSLRMRPMALFERGQEEPTVSMARLLSGSADIVGETTLGLADYIAAIATSGFPDLLGSPEIVHNAQLDSYISRIVDRDLPDQGYSARSRDTLLSWMAAYASATSTTTSYTEILNAATPGQAVKPAKTTTSLYRDKLSQIWMLDPVPAWSGVPRVAKSAKHHLADPALALRLTRISASSLTTTRNSQFLGRLFESLATLSVRVAAEASFATVSHLRTLKGEHEVDLIAQGQDGRVVGIEVKLTANVKDEDVRHLHWLHDQRPDIADLIIVTTGPRAYRRADGIAVVPLALLGA